MSCDVIMPDELSDLRITLGGLRTGSIPLRAALSCTSHATAFLDNLRTHIIDFQDWKLKTFSGVKGNTLTMFVEKYPEKKAYVVLSNEAAGLRLAYMAQNAFHHLEKHLQETPTLYFTWRFVGNDDKVSIELKSDEEAEGLQGSEG